MQKDRDLQRGRGDGEKSSSSRFSRESERPWFLAAGLTRRKEGSHRKKTAGGGVFVLGKIAARAKMTSLKFF